MVEPVKLAALRPTPVKQLKGVVSKPKSKATTRKLNRQIIVAGIEGVVAVVLIALSLGDLIRGIQIITGAERFNAVLLGISIDIGFIALELTMLGVASDKLRKEIEPIARIAIVGTILLSAGLNAVAIAEHAEGLFRYASYALGAVIPGILYATMYVLGKLANDCYKHA